MYIVRLSNIPVPPGIVHTNIISQPAFQATSHMRGLLIASLLTVARPEGIYDFEADDLE